jgi:hypothetical protein
MISMNLHLQAAFGHNAAFVERSVVGKGCTLAFVAQTGRQEAGMQLKVADY